MEFVDISEEMFEKRIEYLRMERKKRSNTASGRSSSQNHDKLPGITMLLKKDIYEAA